LRNSRLLVKHNRRTVSRRLKFQKRSQLLFAASDKPLSVAAICINNPDRSPFTIHSRNAAPTPSSLAEIVSDDFPGLDASSSGDPANTLQSEYRMAFIAGLELTGEMFGTFYEDSSNYTWTKYMPRFASFDQRNYHTLTAREGYARWAETYEDTRFFSRAHLPFSARTRARAESRRYAV
jgi:hypothetical protein